MKDTLQRRHTDGQDTYEKMFNIINHQGNAYQNHEIPSLTSQHGCYQTVNKLNVLARIWGKGTP